MRFIVVALLALLVGSGPAAAQHAHGAHSHYADQTRSHIPSITMEEFEQLRSGEGMGFAKPAELNHYPGPKHVLDLADSLGLSENQRTEIESIRQKMATKAKVLGKDYLHAEHRLNELFSNGNATERNVVKMTNSVEEKRSALRAAHLVAHLETRNVLTAEQVEKYDRLRGYAE